MKGLGVFSPCISTSRCVLQATGVSDSARSESVLSVNDEVSLNLLRFSVVEQCSVSSNPFASQFDNNEPSFLGTNVGLDGYINSRVTNSIGEFTTLNTVRLDIPDGSLTSVGWINLGSDEGTLTLGTSVGDLLLMDGNKFVNNCESSIISNVKICNTPIKCLNFNSKTNMLGVASVDGHISVCDLNNLSDINAFDTSSGKWKVGLVTSLSWNNRLGHILATSGSSVTFNDSSGIVVWDLKSIKPASSFRDVSGRNNPIAIDWVPEQPTQLVVGYGDDNSPSIQLWDLRNSSVPIKEIKGHNRGLSDLKFSIHDPNLLLTSGKDDFTKCWLMGVGEPFNLLSNIRTEALCYHTNIEWHSNIPGLFLGKCTDGGLLLYNIFSGDIHGDYIPCWVNKKTNLTSGFAGSLTLWSNNGDVKFYTSNNKIEPEMCKLLDDTLNKLTNLKDSDTYNNLCVDEINNTNDDNEKLLWSTIKSLYNNNNNTSFIPPLLGFDSSGKLPHEAGAKFVPPSTTPHTSSDTNQTSSSNTFLHFNDPHDSQSAEDFFDSLGKQNVEQLTWGDGVLKDYLVVGNYNEAASYCIRNGMITQGILLAYIGGPELAYRITNDIITRSNDGLLNTIFLIMQGDISSLVSKSQLDDWKETLSYLCTNCNNSPQFKELCNKLGDRLSNSSSHLIPAGICYICGGNFNGITNIMNKIGSDKIGIYKLVDDLIKTAAISIAINNGNYNAEFNNYIVKLAEIYIDGGYLDKALQCLSLPGIPNSSHLNELKQCINTTLSATGVGTGVGISTSRSAPGNVAGASGVSSVASSRSATGFSSVPLQPNVSANVGYNIPNPPSTTGVPLSTFQPSYSSHVPPQTHVPPPSQVQPTQSAPPSHIPPVHNVHTSNIVQPLHVPPPHMPQPVNTYVPPMQYSQPSSSTAPGVVAGVVPPGMPVPWPLPTATQQLGSRTRSTEESNKLAIETISTQQLLGETMPPNDLNMVTNTLQSLTSHGTNARVAQDNHKNINELINLLNKGQLNAEANTLLINMCNAINNGDKVNANITLSTITNKLWNNQNKSWIMCLKRIVPK